MTSSVLLDQWLFMIAALSFSCYFVFTGALMFVTPAVVFEMSDLWRKGDSNHKKLGRPWRKRWSERLIGLCFVAFGAYGGTLVIWGMTQAEPLEITPVPRSNAWEFLLFAFALFAAGLLIASRAADSSRQHLESAPGLLLTTERNMRLRTLWLRLGGITVMVGGLMPLGQWLRSLR